jgi:hypothetical protein
VAEHSFTLPGTSAPVVVVDHRFMRIPQVFVAGQEVERQRDRGRPYWPIPTPGGEKQLFIHGSITGLQGAVDGQLILIEPRLRLWELIVALLPFALVGLGLIGGALGLVASAIDLRLVRRPWPTAVRVAAVLGVFLVALALTLLGLTLTAPRSG